MKPLLPRIAMGCLTMAACFSIQAQTRSANFFSIPESSLPEVSAPMAGKGLTIASIIVGYDNFDPCYGCTGAPVSLPYALRYVHTGVGLIIPVQMQDVSYTGKGTINFRLVQNGTVVKSDFIEANFSPGVFLSSFFVVAPKTAGPADVIVWITHAGETLSWMTLGIELY